MVLARLTQLLRRQTFLPAIASPTQVGVGHVLHICAPFEGKLAERRLLSDGEINPVWCHRSELVDDLGELRDGRSKVVGRSKDGAFGIHKTHGTHGTSDCWCPILLFPARKGSDSTT